MKRIVLPVLLVLAFIAIAVVSSVLQRPAEAREILCADPVKGCAFSHRGLPAQLRFTKRPTPLQPFGLEILSPDARKVSVEMQMVGMSMGFSHYDLRAAVPGIFSSEITLPVCVSGRRDWQMYFDIDGQRYVLPFSTL